MKPSRAMIPGEILCAVFGIVFAWFGWAQMGWLKTVLESRGESVIWMALLGIPAMVTLIFDVREWMLWRRWNLIKREQTARWRGRAVAAQGLCWLYAVYVGYDYGAQLVGTLGIVCFGFCVWAYVENRRTCREIRYATAIAAG